MGLFQSFALALALVLSAPPDDLIASLHQAFPGWLDEEASLNSWSSTWPSPSPRRALGAFGVGNGRVFSLIGLGDPLNSLHGMIGPTYQKDKAFFSDAWTLLERESGPAEFREEKAFQLRGAPVVITASDAGSVQLWTLDFAPTGNIPEWATTCIVRICSAVNTGNEAISGWAFATEVAGPQDEVNGPGLRETVGDRQRIIVSDGSTSRVASGRLISPLPEIPPGASVQTVLGLFTSRSASLGDGPQIGEAKARELLRETVRAWRGRTGLALDCSDQRVSDLVDALCTCIRVQQSETGATCPMSLYTSTWLRDTAGPVFGLLAAGFFEDAKAMLLYQLASIKKSGTIRNSRPCDEKNAEAAIETPWRLESFMPGRVPAEAPSFLPIMVHRYVKATGDLSFLPQSLPILMDCVAQQEVRDGLLPFSGDETFRVAMASQMGLPLEYEFEKKAWSANSAFLYVAAGEATRELAHLIGEDALGDSLSDRIDEVRSRTESAFWDPGGFYAPFLFKEDGRLAPSPYLDVNAMPLWIGYASPENDRAVSNVLAIIQRLQSGAGTFHGRIHDRFLPLGLWLKARAVHTGMTYGLALDSLTQVDHPAAESAFDALISHALSSGTYSEYMVEPGPASLTLAYDRTGVLGDYTGQYRPWEGGINLRALLDYGVGCRPDAVAGEVTFAPHLPASWDHLDVRGLRIGKNQLDVRMEGNGSSRRFSVALMEGPGLRVAVRLSCPWDGESEAGMDGEQMRPVGDMTPWGRASFEFPQVDLRAGEVRRFAMERRDGKTGP